MSTAVDQASDDGSDDAARGRKLKMSRRRRGVGGRQSLVSHSAALLMQVLRHPLTALIVLASAISLASSLAIFFGVAWASQLVPYASIWGSVADWVNALAAWFTGLVTLGAFVIAGFTYAHYRHEAQRQEREELSEQDQADLEFERGLREAVNVGWQEMVDEASLVGIWIEKDKYQPTANQDELSYAVVPVLRNRSRKMLTDIEMSVDELTLPGDPPVQIPPTVSWISGGEREYIWSKELDVRFVGLDRDRRQYSPWRASFNREFSVENDGPSGHESVLAGKLRFRFRIGDGPRWVITYNPKSPSLPHLEHQ